MKRDEIFTKLATILNETFEIPLDEISMDSHIVDDLDLDSIDAVDLIVNLQKFTTKNIDPEKFRQVRTVKDIVEAIEQVL
ncbi:MAG: acyl carrier protein [Fibrobacterales bacterium]